jgi:5-methylcytosine-specific restriction endonuclease McrA
LARFNLRSGRQWKELETLFETQNGKCAVTGIPLELGSTASVDHIIPRCKGGPEDITNVRFVHLWINVMKKDLPEEDFINKLDIWLLEACNSRNLI